VFNADDLLGRLMNSGAASGFLGGLAGGGAVGMLQSKKGRKMAKKALKVGGIAAVGALAYHAYTKYKQGQTVGAGVGAGAAVPMGASPAAELPPPPAGSPFLPAATNREAVQSLGVTLIRAMIAAAKADGEIDATEGQRLFARMNDASLSGEEKTFLLQELSRPVDVDSLVAAAKTPELAAEVYTASLMAIEVSNPAESAYLQLLSSRLKLEPGLVAELQKAVTE
jgi:uncharacterized membrane protein YebE (DUF533 family)